MEIIKPPYLQTVIEVEGADSEETVIVDMGSLPIRASVQLVVSAQTDYVVSIGDDPDNMFEYDSDTITTIAIIEFPTPTFRYLEISMTPDSTADIQAIVHTKF